MKTLQEIALIIGKEQYWGSCPELCMKTLLAYAYAGNEHVIKRINKLSEVKK